MRAILIRAGKYLLPLIPGVLGVIGLCVLAEPPESLGNAMYKSLCMYLVNFNDDPPNLLVNIARWLAPMCTASGLVMAVVAARDRITEYLRFRSGKGVAVYGSTEEKAAMLSQLGKWGIDGKGRFVRANRYILLQEESEVFAFYNRFRQSFGNADVFVKCGAIPAQAASSPHLHLFCPEETAARVYWKQRDVYEISRSRGHQIEIVLLGFGRLGREILTYALQDNIFSPNQHIEYHIFGEGAQFRSVHTQLASISDPVIFHAEPWYEQLPLLERAGMVLVLAQDDQLALLRDLLLATTRRRIDVLAADDETPNLLDGGDRLALFAWKREGQRLENVFSDELLALAKRINFHYASGHGSLPDRDRALDDAWRRLDAFTRYSNICAADYHDIRLRMLADMGLSPKPDALPAEVLELLAELEHIRWCRFHWLNNWRYGVPENGKAKDHERRIHTDLVPYAQLTPTEKEKNREEVRLLLSLDAQK